MWINRQFKTLLPAGCLCLAALFLPACSSSAKKEALENDSKYILAQAKQAYFEEDFRKVFQLLFPLAASGNGQAQYTLGYLYHHGLGVEKSDQQAMNWIQRAAAQGNKKALEALKNVNR